MHEGLYAQPGDLDLDCDVEGLTITAVVASDTCELMVRFVGGTGWWLDSDDQRVEFAGGDDRVDEFTINAKFQEQDAPTFASFVDRLYRWRDTGARLRLCCAPYRFTTVIHTRSDWLMFPRCWPFDPVAGVDG